MFRLLPVCSGVSVCSGISMYLVLLGLRFFWKVFWKLRPKKKGLSGAKGWGNATYTTKFFGETYFFFFPIFIFFYISRKHKKNRFHGNICDLAI